MWHGERAPKDNTKRETFFLNFNYMEKAWLFPSRSMCQTSFPYGGTSYHIPCPLVTLLNRLVILFNDFYVCFYVIKIIFLYINCCETKRIVFRNLNAIFADMWIAVKTIMKYIRLLITYVLTFIEIKTAAIERSTGSQTKITHS